MFKFNFELDAKDIDDEPFTSESHSQKTATEQTPSQIQKTSNEIQLLDLLNKLPSVISYSPLPITLSDGSVQCLARRDLYDAKFQVIAQEGVGKDSSQHTSEDWANGDSDFLRVPSDLVSGVYEGGLKTWECSVDLAAYLHELLHSDEQNITCNNILELGCGTAVPSLFLLQHHLLVEPSSPKRDINIHLQDFNELVFRLVTVPNLILTWYMSPASSSYRESEEEQESPRGDADIDPLPLVDPAQPGDLPISPALVSAFLDSLKARRINIRLITGSWETFDLNVIGGRYDIVLTSETIYRMESLPSLVNLLRQACAPRNDEASTDESLAQLSTSNLSISASPKPYQCLVAAKLVYFGVGGGVSEFIRAVEHGPPTATGKVQMVKERKEGVKRSIMKVIWLSNVCNTS